MLSFKKKEKKLRPQDLTKESAALIRKKYFENINF
jgi:hypothetical protein